MSQQSERRSPSEARVKVGMEGTEEQYFCQSGVGIMIIALNHGV